jgi:hypothetical protein
METKVLTGEQVSSLTKKSGKILIGISEDDDGGALHIIRLSLAPQYQALRRP